MQKKEPKHDVTHLLDFLGWFQPNQNEATMQLIVTIRKNTRDSQPKAAIKIPSTMEPSRKPPKRLSILIAAPPQAASLCLEKRRKEPVAQAAPTKMLIIVPMVVFIHMSIEATTNQAKKAKNAAAAPAIFKKYFCPIRPITAPKTRRQVPVNQAFVSSQ